MTRNWYLILGVSAVLAYGAGITWGIPMANRPDAVQSWAVDDETPLGPLAQLHNIVEPKDMQNLGYPLMHSFLVTAAYAPYLGYLWVADGFRPSDTYPFGFRDPGPAMRTLAIIARLVSLLMAAVLVVAAYDAGRHLFDERGGRLAGAFALASYPMFYYGRTGNVDVPMMAFLGMGLAAYARMLRGGVTPGRAVLLGIGVGGAMATKEPAAAAALGIPFVVAGLLWDSRARWGGMGRWSFWRNPFLGLAACGLTFGLGSGLFVDPDRYAAHLKFVQSRVKVAATGEFDFVQVFPYTLEGHLRLLAHMSGLVIDAVTLGGVVLCGVGIWWAARSRGRVLWFLLPAATYFAVLFWSVRIGMLRYILPVAFPLIVFGGAGGSFLLSAVRGWLRRGAAVAIGAVLCVALARGADLTFEMWNDSRYEAAAWLAQRLDGHERIEYFGARQKLPDLPATVTVNRASRYMGAVVEASELAPPADVILDGLATRRPDVIIVMPDHSSLPGREHSGNCPPEVYDRLMDGSAGYTLAAVFKGRRLLPWLSRPTLDYPTVNPPIRVFMRPAARPNTVAGPPAGGPESHRVVPE